MDKSKENQLRKAVLKFECSKRTVKDYMEFIPVVNSVLRQGSGLVWSQVEEVLKNALKPNGNLDLSGLTENQRKILVELRAKKQVVLRRADGSFEIEGFYETGKIVLIPSEDGFVVFQGINKNTIEHTCDMVRLNYTSWLKSSFSQPDLLWLDDMIAMGLVRKEIYANYVPTEQE